MASPLYDLSARLSNGKDIGFNQFAGQVLLIVNTASECGFTPQYAGLEMLHSHFHDKGFSVLGFPCNQFGSQEPGTDDQIVEFCQINYGVSFPIFSKIDVNGEHAHPLYRFLKQQAKGILGSEAIKWNFTKFLVNRRGEVVERFAPTTKPEDMAQAIEVLCAA